jgi:hypothetical protein
VRLVAVVAAIALSAAAPASASMWPPPAPQAAQHVVKLAHGHTGFSIHSCALHSKIARWLAPVACEQPPRSQLLLVQALFG